MMSLMLLMMSLMLLMMSLMLLISLCMNICDQLITCVLLCDVYQQTVCYVGGARGE